MPVKSSVPARAPAKVRIGLLGAARISKRAILEPALLLAGRVEVVAVAASSQGKADAFAFAHGIARSYGSYQALLDDPDIDLVYNALPASLHATWSIAAARAGKHVLCEKPFAMNALQAKAMLEAARAQQVLLLEGYHYRFHPLFLQVEALVHSGVLGDIHTARSHFSVRIPAFAGSLRHELALGGGALMDLGCYPLHWLRTLFGDNFQIQQASAICHRPQVDSSFSAELLFMPATAPVLTAYLGCSMAEHLGTQHLAYLQLEGSLGSLTIDNLVAPQQGYQFQLTAATADSPLQAEMRQMPAQTDGHTTYFYQLQHLLDCLQHGATPLTGGADALTQMQGIDALYQAAGLTPRPGN